MNEELCSWYQGLSYEKGFGPDEVSSFKQKKKQRDTYSILSGEDGGLLFFGHV